MNYLDLFSGIGGFAIGAYWAGWRFDRHYFSEVDPWCCKLYQQRFPDAVPLGDIREIDGTTLLANAGRARLEKQDAVKTDQPCGSGAVREGWILTGGFPCQDISVAGKGAGIGGARSGLWFEYARLIGEIRPRYAIMENVGALTRRGLDRVLGSLAEIGYDAQWSDIRASDVGAPHRRERIWIVAYPGRERGRTLGAESQGRKGASVSVGSGEHWNANGEQQAQVEGILERENANGSGDGRAIPDAHVQGLAQREGESGDDGAQQSALVRADWWAVEPDVGRVAHGIPARVDRLRGLGNAIVPQIAEMIFRGIV